MLLIRCARCKRKLWKYRKIGPGQLLVCHKDRVSRVWEYTRDGEDLLCVCGTRVAIDKGDHLKIIGTAITASGERDNG